jgi:DnaJ-class molecular chaperone
MSRREAGLILGIRESSTEDKIMKAHRKLMFLNHPDNGGSTYVATKINEAKEALLEGSGKK